MRTYSIFFIIFLAVSCNSNQKKNETVSSVAAENLTDEELKQRVKKIEEEEKKMLEAEIANRTTIAFEKLVHDFGKVKPETDNQYKFKFTNTGNKPLIIKDVKASCGCTTPYKPEKPILPGNSDVIDVNFHPKRSQSGDISKTITVEANTESKLIELQIKAFVEN
jgi:uncharacterized protein YcfL